LLADHPDLQLDLTMNDSVLSFRWGGDLSECAWALGAAAALMEAHGALVYSPQEDLVYAPGELRKEFEDVMRGPGVRANSDGPC
jgi:hypothetical protein